MSEPAAPVPPSKLWRVFTVAGLLAWIGVGTLRVAWLKADVCGGVGESYGWDYILVFAEFVVLIVPGFLLMLFIGVRSGRGPLSMAWEFVFWTLMLVVVVLCVLHAMSLVDRLHEVKLDPSSGDCYGD